MVYLCYAIVGCDNTFMPCSRVRNIEKAMPLKADRDAAAAVGLTLGAEHVTL